LARGAQLKAALDYYYSFTKITNPKVKDSDVKLSLLEYFLEHGDVGASFYLKG
jgi:hypothetical protein